MGACLSAPRVRGDESSSKVQDVRKGTDSEVYVTISPAQLLAAASSFTCNPTVVPRFLTYSLLSDSNVKGLAFQELTGDAHQNESPSNVHSCLQYSNKSLGNDTDGFCDGKMMLSTLEPSLIVALALHHSHGLLQQAPTYVPGTTKSKPSAHNLQYKDTTCLCQLPADVICWLACTCGFTRYGCPPSGISSGQQSQSCQLSLDQSMYFLAAFCQVVTRACVHHYEGAGNIDSEPCGILQPLHHPLLDIVKRQCAPLGVQHSSQSHCLSPLISTVLSHDGRLSEDSDMASGEHTEDSVRRRCWALENNQQRRVSEASAVHKRVGHIRDGYGVQGSYIHVHHRHSDIALQHHDMYASATLTTHNYKHRNRHSSLQQHSRSRQRHHSVWQDSEGLDVIHDSQYLGNKIVEIIFNTYQELAGTRTDRSDMCQACTCTSYVHTQQKQDDDDDGDGKTRSNQLRMHGHRRKWPSLNGDFAPGASFSTEPRMCVPKASHSPPHLTSTSSQSANCLCKQGSLLKFRTRLKQLRILHDAMSAATDKCCSVDADEAFMEPGSCCWYLTGPGDTTQSVCKAAGCTLEELYAANPGLGNDSCGVSPHDMLCLPVPAVLPRLYVLQPGDSWVGVARREGVALSALLAANAGWMREVAQEWANIVTTAAVAASDNDDGTYDDDIPACSQFPSPIPSLLGLTSSPGWIVEIPGLFGKLC